MNRAELQRLAQERLDDAKVMMAQRRWPAAYYLAGYAIELGLKSCLLRHLDATGIIYSDPEFFKSLGKCRSHDFTLLLQLAGLEKTLGTSCKGNPTFGRNWAVVKDWKETSRYENTPEAKCRDFLDAVTNFPDGVLQWLQIRW